MAFATKYKLEAKDTLGTLWTAEIQKDDYAGDVTTLKGAADFLNFEYFGDDDMFSQNIMGSRCTINVYAFTDFAFSDLFSCENFEYKVLIKYGSTLFWTGFILADSHTESYDGTPYLVSITATDGLGLLSAFKWDDLGITTRTNVASVIYAMLSNVQITSFTEFVNIFESTMNQTINDSPLDQIGIHQDAFKGEDCYTALNEILKSFNAGIRQDQGAFIIYRFLELKDTSMKGRIFTSGSSKSSTTQTPLQYINRPTQPSNLWSYDGGSIMMSPRIKNLIANHDYQFRKSIFKNPDFPFEEFDGSYDISGWVKSTDTDSRPLANAMKGGDENGVYITDTSALHDHYISQEISVAANTNNLLVKIEAGAWGENESGQIDIEIISKNTDLPALVKKYNYSFATGVGAWEDNVGDAPVYITILNDTFQANLEFKEIVFPLNDIPYTGQLSIRLYNGVSVAASVVAAYKLAGIYEVDYTGMMLEGIGYDIQTSSTGQVYEIEYKLGDGHGYQLDYLQFKGAYSRTASTSKSWETVTAGTGNNENTSLIQIVSSELGTEFGRPRQIIDLPILERDADTFLKLVGNIKDVTNTVSGNSRIFIPVHGTYKVVDRSWYLTVMEII